MTPHQAAVVAEAARWIDTPYHHLGDIKGAGVDCAMLLVRVFSACGAIPAGFDPRPYAHDWHLHHSEEIFRGWVEQFAELQPAGEPEPADVVLWRYGRAYSHGAIVMEAGAGAPIVHAQLGAARVCWGRLDDAELVGRPSLRYRIPAINPSTET